MFEFTQGLAQSCYISALLAEVILEKVASASGTRCEDLIRFIMRIFTAQLLKDAKKHAEVLRDSDVDWVIVRGPRLTDGEKRGDYRIGWVGVNSGKQISRADLSDFILKQMEEDMFDGQMPFVSY